LQRVLAAIAVAAAALVVPGTAAEAKLRVFACEPEWAALADELGGAKVKSYAATHAQQDPHYIRARPSLLSAMRRSDLVICSGAGLEVGWLPVLVQRAGRRSVQPGKVGYLMASQYVPVLEVPEVVDRSQGDVHPDGNPHVHLNPHNIHLVANEVTRRLQVLDARNADQYKTRFADFSRRWQAAIADWEARARPLVGMQVVTHHKSWTYLIDWLRLDLAGTLERKPGIPPSVGHLEALLQDVRGADVRAIIRTPYAPDDASNWLSGKTGIAAMVLPYTIGGEPDVTDLFTLFERHLQHLLDVAGD